MVASFGLENNLFAARALLIMLPFLKFFESINRRGFPASMRSGDGSIIIAGPASPASMALAARAKLQTQASLAKKLATDNPAGRVPMFAIQTIVNRHSILKLFPSPRLTELVIKQVPERPDIQLLFAPYRRVLVFVLKSSMEARRYAVAGASIADSRASLSYPTRQFFKLFLVAKDTFEVREWHDAGTGVISGFG